MERYVTLTDTALLRMFDFTRFKQDSFNGWHKDEKKLIEGENIFGRIVIEPGYASYSRGIQIADIRFDKQELIDAIWGRSSAKVKGEYVRFIAQDWKHGVIKECSCDPADLGNYFVESDKPLETSPVFFRPEVLAKYKADREKYQLKSRSISCRGGWELKTFDINDAGQIHTYLVYLGHLPFEEQLHWKQFNEPPKAVISARSFKTDFEGSWDESYDALTSLKKKLYDLRETEVKWWRLRDQQAFDKVHYPFTTSKDEWADEIMNLDQLLIEGFEEKWLRLRVQDLGRPKNDQLRALKLVEECLVGVGFEESHARELMGVFHDVHNLRSKLKGHASGEEATQIRKDAFKNLITPTITPI